MLFILKWQTSTIAAATEGAQLLGDGGGRHCGWSRGMESGAEMVGGVEELEKVLEMLVEEALEMGGGGRASWR